MDRNGSKAYRGLLQFKVIACTMYLILLFWKKNSMKREIWKESRRGCANRCSVLDLMVKISSIRDHYRHEDSAALHVSSARSRCRIYHCRLKKRERIEEVREQSPKEQIFHLNGHKNVLNATAV